jgi:hypothetical protein
MAACLFCIQVSIILALCRAWRTSLPLCAASSIPKHYADLFLHLYVYSFKENILSHNLISELSKNTSTFIMYL